MYRLCRMQRFQLPTQIFIHSDKMPASKKRAGQPVQTSGAPKKYKLSRHGQNVASSAGHDSPRQPVKPTTLDSASETEKGKNDVSHDHIYAAKDQVDTPPTTPSPAEADGMMTPPPSKACSPSKEVSDDGLSEEELNRAKNATPPPPPPAASSSLKNVSTESLNVENSDAPPPPPAASSSPKNVSTESLNVENSDAPPPPPAASSSPKNVSTESLNVENSDAPPPPPAASSSPKNVSMESQNVENSDAPSTADEAVDTALIARQAAGVLLLKLKDLSHLLIQTVTRHSHTDDKDEDAVIDLSTNQQPRPSANKENYLDVSGHNDLQKDKAEDAVLDLSTNQQPGKTENAENSLDKMKNKIQMLTD